MEREQFGSRLGFLLMSAGCAIGIGNVWKFPYMAGEGMKIATWLRPYLAYVLPCVIVFVFIIGIYNVFAG